MKYEYGLLVEAICWFGTWSWWNEKFPEYISVEFGRTRLWSPPIEEGKPPDTMIMLVFFKPISVSFISRGNVKDSHWPDRLHDDKMPHALAIQDPTMTFEDTSMIEEFIDQAKKIDTRFGTDPRQVDWENAPQKLVFWAGYYGMAISAEQMILWSRQGEVSPDELVKKWKKFDEYYRNYWAFKIAKKTSPYPYDPICEINIPLTGGWPPGSFDLPDES